MSSPPPPNKKRPAPAPSPPTGAASAPLSTPFSNSHPASDDAWDRPPYQPALAASKLKRPSIRTRASFRRGRSPISRPYEPRPESLPLLVPSLSYNARPGPYAPKLGTLQAPSEDAPFQPSGPLFAFPVHSNYGFGPSLGPTPYTPQPSSLSAPSELALAHFREFQPPAQPSQLEWMLSAIGSFSGKGSARIIQPMGPGSSQGGRYEGEGIQSHPHQDAGFQLSLHNRAHQAVLQEEAIRGLAHSGSNTGSSWAPAPPFNQGQDAGSSAQTPSPDPNQRPATDLTGRREHATFGHNSGHRAFPSSVSRPNSRHDSARYTLPPPAQLLSIAPQQDARSILSHSFGAGQALMQRREIPPPTIQPRVEETMLRYLVRDGVVYLESGDGRWVLHSAY